MLEKRLQEKTQTYTRGISSPGEQGTRNQLVWSSVVGECQFRGWPLLHLRLSKNMEEGHAQLEPVFSEGMDQLRDIRAHDPSKGRCPKSFFF